MNPCARACCWTPFSCATSRDCPCHWDDKRPTTERGSPARHRDPTATQAIRNITKGKPR